MVRPIFLSRPRRADTYWGLLKLPDKQKLAGDWGGDSRRSGLIDFSDFTVKREVPAVTRSHKYLVETPTLPNLRTNFYPRGHPGDSQGLMSAVHKSAWFVTLARV